MIIITGGAGFIGSNLVAGLEVRGIQPLVVVDHLGTDSKWRNLQKREVAGIVAPARLFDFLDANAAEIEIIYHLGAISTTTESDVDLIIENNFMLSLKLLEWAASNGTRLIYASSAATYGDGSAGFEDREDHQYMAQLKPLNPYGWSKHLFDRRVSRLRQDGSPLPPQCVGLKFFNVYGPNEYHKGSQRSVAVQLYQQVKSGNAARLFRSNHPDYADGEQLRDFVYVADCVRTLLFFFDYPEISGLYNIGSGKARSFNDLTAAMFGALGKEPQIEFIDPPPSLINQYQYRTEATMDKLRAAGFSDQFTSLEAGVKTYIQVYLEQADCYV